MAKGTRYKYFVKLRNQKSEPEITVTIEATDAIIDARGNLILHDGMKAIAALTVGSWVMMHRDSVETKMTSWSDIREALAREKPDSENR